jgi:hypothetical protein
VAFTGFRKKHWLTALRRLIRQESHKASRSVFLTDNPYITSEARMPVAPARRDRVLDPGHARGRKVCSNMPSWPRACPVKPAVGPLPARLLNAAGGQRLTALFAVLIQFDAGRFLGNRQVSSNVGPKGTRLGNAGMFGDIYN